ncbi:protein N-lysine methyltransferase METTL21A isoform X3 [Brachypodium distachyon]|nr:protein N-lysine methyltransferase METTL21A isoform X3 [Brachypodium distachyon]|eukprot:XP_024313735.1 protein N-lysine methyltransferase METTL21A isoform X3 [Brachypodium distachyon]
MTTFTYGSQVLQLLCLRAASTDYDLTGQLVWPGAVLMNTYLSEHPETVKGCSIIELGSGIGITGILCSRFCKEVVLTDHNDEVLEIIKKNVEVQSCSENADAVLTAEKLEWGNYDHINNIIEKHPSGFDLILGADICFQQSSIPYLFDTVEKLLRMQAGKCRFILAYVSRAKVMDALLPKEAEKRGMLVEEVDGTRTTISNLEGKLMFLPPCTLMVLGLSTVSLTKKCRVICIGAMVFANHQSINETTRHWKPLRGIN